MAKATKQNQSSKSESATGQTSGAQNAGAIEMLKQDHRKVEDLFEKFEQESDEEEKDRIARRICSELIVHTRLEEDIFYPACRDAGVEDDAMDEAQVEHDSAKALLNDLLEASAGTPYFEAKVSVLKELIKHHVEEEERPGQGTFAKAQEHGIDDSGIGERLRRRKQELQGRAAGKRPIRAVSLHDDQEDRMPRYNTPERDEYGRFMSDDDRDYGRRSRSRYEDDDDDYRRGRGGGRGHGGWYGDSEGHSEAARERWGSRRGGRYEDDDYDDRRYSRSRYDDDDDYERGGRGHGGWFGDPRGHAEASREGWEHRGGRRYDDDDYDDRRGRGRGGGHGGWFGDPRGHAEASRMGWRHRR